MYFELYKAAKHEVEYYACDCGCNTVAEMWNMFKGEHGDFWKHQCITDYKYFLKTGHTF